jgi:hypothetical protein
MSWNTRQTIQGLSLHLYYLGIITVASEFFLLASYLKTYCRLKVSNEAHWTVEKY